MISAGIDVGSEITKVVLLRDGQILSYSLAATASDVRGTAEQLLQQALEKGGISRRNVESIAATGSGRGEVTFANDTATEVTCDVKGVIWLHPSARTVIDIGAETGRALKCNATGRCVDFAKNDRCAAGAGTFVAAMAKALEVRIEDMGKLSLLSENEIPINVTCVVFAESEAVSLIHSGTQKCDITHAIHNAIATRTSAMARRVGIERDVVLIGGLAWNEGFVDSLRRELGGELVIPENPQIVGALGAALLAHEAKKGG